MKRERLLFIYYFAIGLYTAVLFGLGFAIFNITVGAKYLPFVYIIFPLLDAVTALLMARLITKRGIRTFFHRFLIVVIGVHVLMLPVLFQYTNSWWSFGLMLVLLIAVSENLLFTRSYLVQEVFALDELRRWIPVAISYGAIGALIGGAILRATEGILAPGIVFLFVLPALLVIEYTTHSLLDTVRGKGTEIFGKRMVTGKSIWRYATGQSFLPLLIACVAIIAVSDTVNEYLFHFHSTSIIQDIDRLTGFLGVFLTIRYSTELFLNLFLYNRLVKRIGSINIMPVLLVVAALSLVIMNLTQGQLYWVLFARTLSAVAVLGFLMYLLEVFYQLFDPLYRPALVTLVGYIDAFAGYALGGGILVIHSMGGLSVELVIVGLSILLLAFAVLWMLNKKGFIDMLDATQSADVSSSVEDLIGSVQSTEMIETLIERARSGSRSERLFLFYTIKKQPVEKQMDWLSSLFEMSEMELRVTILEHVFESDLYDFEPTLHNHELTDDFKNWLVMKCFTNYYQMHTARLFQKLREVLEDTQPMDDAVKYMMKYMFKNQHECYGMVLKALHDRKRIEDKDLINNIIMSYKGHEDEVHMIWFREDHIASPQVMVYYDQALDYKALRYYLGFTDYKLFTQVIEAYPLETLVEQLDHEDKTIVEWVCLAEAERRENHSYSHYSKLLSALYHIIKTEREIDLDHASAQLLKFELHQLRVAAESVLVDQSFDRGHISLAGQSYSYLVDSRKRPILIEMIRGMKRDKWTECLLGLLETEIDYCNISHEVFRFGDKGDWIESLLAYNRGENMDENRKNEIDFMIALKSIQMFESLDIDTLKKLAEIATVSPMNSGDTIVRKGRRGSKFFVLLKGQAAVYLNEKEAPIAIIPEGDMIGELAVINNDIRTATVKADGPVELLAMEGEAFLELIQKNSAISLAVIQTLSYRLTDMLKAREKSL